MNCLRLALVYTASTSDLILPQLQDSISSTDTHTLNIALKEIQHDTECEKAGSLNYNSFLPGE